MNRPNSDPVSEAQSAVAAAERTLGELLAQRDAVASHGKGLAKERAKIAFAAHGTGNKQAKDRLAAIHREITEIGSEIASYDAAIEEAEARLATSRRHVEQETDRRRAREALEHLDRLLQHAHGADAALRAYREAIVAVDKAAEKVCAVARQPSRTIVLGAIRRSLSSELTSIHAITEIPLADPMHRHPLTYWANAWAASVRGALQRRIDGVPDTQLDEEAA
jgi:DNA repair exonuclease SbcCD ATPase subunit